MWKVAAKSKLAEISFYFFALKDRGNRRQVNQDAPFRQAFLKYLNRYTLSRSLCAITSKIERTLRTTHNC